MNTFESHSSQLSSLFEYAFDAVVAIDGESVIIQWNQQSEAMFGWSKNEIIGKKISETIIPAPYRKMHEAGLQKFMNSGAGKIFNQRIELSALKKDGSQFPIELTVTPYKTDELFCFYAFIRDLTVGKKNELLLHEQQKKLEQVLDEKIREVHRAHKFLNAVIENVPDMIFTKDAKELRFVSFNKSGEELLGYPREELIGKNDYDFFPQHEANFFTGKDRATLESGKTTDIPEETIQTRLKGNRILHTRKVALYDEAGQPEYLLGISEDITEKKQAEENRQRLAEEKIARAEAEKSLKLRDEFMSIAAHELNTPLTALTLQLHLTNKMLPDNKPAQELLASAMAQVDRFGKLISNLLDASRASAGMLNLDKSEADLSEIVNRVIKWHDLEFKKMNYNYELNIEEQVVGNWDPLRLEQVVINLINNAIKFGAGKPIHVSLKKNGSHARLVVEDHGIGLDADSQVAIFNRFTRAASIKTYAGLGLGLYITSQIVLAHKGTIRVESAPMQGARFIVELPL